MQHFVWPGITFSWQAQHFRQMEWKDRKTHWYEAVSSALKFPFLKEISQNGFVFDVVNLKNWGSLAELLCFWRYQGNAFLTLPRSKIEEVSQESFVFKLADRQADRQTDGQTGRQTRTDGRGQDRTGQDRTGQDRQTDRYTDRWMDGWIDRYIMDKQKDK